MTAAACAAFVFVLSSFQWPVLDLPPISLNSELSLNLDCRNLHSDQTAFQHNVSSTSVSIGARTDHGVPTTVTCDIDVFNRTANASLVNITAHIQISEGQLRVQTQPEADGSCFTQLASVKQPTTCDIVANVTKVTFPGEIPFLEAGIIAKIVAALDHALLNGLFCQSLGPAFEKLVASHKINPPTPIPLPPPWIDTPPLSDDKYIRAVTNVVKSLPELAGLTLGLTIVQSNALHLSILIHEPIDLTDVLGPFTNGFVREFYLPENMTIGADIAIDGFQCHPMKGECHLSGAINLFNIRLGHAGDAEVIFDNMLAPAIGSLANDLLNIVLGLAELKANGTLVFSVPKEAHFHMFPPPVVFAVAVPILFIVFVLSLVFSFRRHLAARKDDPRKLVALPMARDTLITGLCVGACLCFLMSNTSDAVTVVMGGEVTLYSFSLGNTINDMWGAGLYALAILIAIFSGFYPYFKCAVILIVSVVMHRPTNLGLRIIDVFGKFSFLDSIVLMIIVTALKIPGIAEVNVYWSFYSFLLATGMSLLAGNLATIDLRRKKAKTVRAAEINDVGDKRCVSSSQNVTSSFATEEIRTRNGGTPPLQEDEGCGAAKQPLLFEGTGPSYSTTTALPQASASGLGSSNAGGQGSMTSDSRRRLNTSHVSWDPEVKSPVHVLPSHHATSFDGGPKSTDSAHSQTSLYSHESEDEFDELVRHGQQLANKSFGPENRRRCRLCLCFGSLWLLGLAITTAGVVIPMVVAPLRYHFSGFSTVLLGSHQDYTLVRLMKATTWPVALAVGSTVFGFPILFAVFPFLRVAGSWCATDVFILACVAGLLQLHQFVTFVAGKMLSPLMQVHAELRWPLYAMGASALIQWILVVRTIRSETDREQARLKREQAKREKLEAKRLAKEREVVAGAGADNDDVVVKE